MERRIPTSGIREALSLPAPPVAPIRTPTPSSIHFPQEPYLSSPQAAAPASPEFIFNRNSPEVLLPPPVAPRPAGTTNLRPEPSSPAWTPPLPRPATGATFPSSSPTPATNSAPHPIKQPDQNCPKLPALHSSAPAAATAEESSFSVAAEPPFGGGGHDVDGSIQNIQRDTIVKWEVDCAEIDPNELQSMEEKAVKKLVEKIGKTMLWGPEQEEGWASLRAEFLAELVDLNIESKVGYVPSHLAMQKADDDWASQRHIVPIITDLTVIAVGANADAEEGNVAVVDWNAVKLEEPIDLVIAPIADTEMTKLFGIPVDDRDKEERDEPNTRDNDDTKLSEAVDEQLMEGVADDVDDAHDE
ncbi:hypothetical protein D1007_20300 [Hordeum vulgare]|nr:hypothetical protein D1007_20300 [Hordeum vulgare]